MSKAVFRSRSMVRATAPHPARYARHPPPAGGLGIAPLVLSVGEDGLRPARLPAGVGQVRGYELKSIAWHLRALV